MSVAALRALLVRYAAQASVVAFCALLVAGMWIGLVLQLHWEREEIIATAHLGVGNYARVFEAHVARTLRAVEVVLDEIEADYRRLGARLDLARLARERRTSLDPYYSLAVVDRDGNLILADYAIRDRPNFKDRENYQFHVAHDTRETFISQPRRATSGPNAGKWSIIISIRVNRPDGGFAGYVAVVMDPFYFSQLYSKVELGRGSIVALVGRDGVIRARQEDEEHSAGQDVSGSAMFLRIQKSPVEGQFVGRGQLASMTRLYSYRMVQDYPLVVVVGRSEAAVLSSYASRRAAYLGWAGGATLLIALFAALLVYQIGHRSRSDARVRESEQRYLELVEQASDGIFIADASGRYLQFNEAARAMLGYTEEELRAMSMRDLVPEEDQRREPLRIDELRAGKSLLTERRLLRKDGSLLPVEISARKLSNGMLQAVVRDVGARKRVEESLRASEARLKEAQALAKLGNWELDLVGGRLTWSDEIYRIFELDAAQFGASYEAFLNAIHPDDRESVNRVYTASVANRTSYAIVHRLRTSDGRIKHVQERGQTFYAEDGKPLRSVGTVQDVTALHEAEQALRALNAELEARVEARTAELRRANSTLAESLEELRAAQVRLVQSEKMAALGSLVAGIAHEINTPLGIGVTAASHVELTVRGLQERFAHGQPTRQEMEGFLSSASEACEMVLANLQRAADLIRSFKQVAVDQSSGERRTFSLKPYLDEVLRSLGPQLRRTRHEVLLVCPENLEIDSYPGAYSQIVTNLVLNSLTHGFDGIEHGRIEIEVLREGESLRLRYRDNGRGIAPEHLPKIFDPFFTTKRGLGGSGLGLHVLYNLVTQTLGGTIECRSRPGEGVSFDIDLPMRPPRGTPA